MKCRVPVLVNAEETDVPSKVADPRVGRSHGVGHLGLPMLLADLTCFSAKGGNACAWMDALHHPRPLLHFLHNGTEIAERRNDERTFRTQHL